MSDHSHPHSLLSALEQVKAIALEGLCFAQNPYDVDRYTKLLHLATHEYSLILKLDEPYLLEKFRSEIGIVTPKLGAEAAIFNENGQLLILRRKDDARWGLPGGWVDVQESPAEAAVREAREEAGLTVTPEAYLSISTRFHDLGDSMPHQINIVTLMHTVPADVSVVLSHEHTDYTWINGADADVEWHQNHAMQVERVYEYIATGKRRCLPIR